MTEAAMRVHCPWCTTRLNAQAAVCHRCGAIKKRRPLSMLKLFFLHPLIGAVLAMAGLTLPLIDLSVVKAAGVFAATWLILSAIHIALRQRRFWVQLEPLLLKEDEGEEQIAHSAPFKMSPALVTAATVMIGIGVVWATAPQQVQERVATATASVAPAAEKPATTTPPVNVAVVEPPREALPPTPASQPWKPDLTAAVATVETPKVETPAPDKMVVLTAQRLLSDLGYDVGGIDGRIGSKTRAAIKSFRERTGLGSEDINAGLIAALESAAVSSQTSASAAPTDTRPVARNDSRPTRPIDPARPADTQLATATPPAATPRSIDSARPADTATPPVAPRTAEPMRPADSSLSTASLNRESAQKAATPPAPAPRPAPPAPAPSAQVPVNGTLMPMVPRSGDNAPPRMAPPPRPPSQQAEAAPSISVTPRTVPIHTLVPTIPAQATGPIIVDPSGAGSASRDMQAPVRLGPPVRLHY
jgi:peptidoglycan hydrolase-like protein with peptidoglycan-binding domain